MRAFKITRLDTRPERAVEYHGRRVQTRGNDDLMQELERPIDIAAIAVRGDQHAVRGFVRHDPRALHGLAHIFHVSNASLPSERLQHAVVCRHVSSDTFSLHALKHGGGILVTTRVHGGGEQRVVHTRVQLHVRARKQAFE